MQSLCRSIPILIALLCATLSPSTHATPKVVASIIPIHSLVSAVMQDIGETHLLLPSGSSPHDYALRPSAMRALQQADAVFWIGPELESALTKPLAALAPTMRTEALLATPGLMRLRLRTGGIWATAVHQHDRIDPHQHGIAGTDWDAHIWLDPSNAQLMVAHIAATMSAIDPINSEQYQANAQIYQTRIQAMREKIAQDLAAVRQTPYIVFHDAYQYFEHAFELQPVGALTLHPERQPGARRIQDIRAQIKDNKVHCVFSEPQFRPALVQTLIADSTTQSAVLDPLGANLRPGPEAYLELLLNLAHALGECLSH